MKRSALRRQALRRAQNEKRDRPMSAVVDIDAPPPEISNPRDPIAAARWWIGERFERTA